MEGISALREIVQPHDVFTKIDLEDAFHTVPVHKDYKKFLQLVLEGNLHQYNCLPFGLSKSPWVFTKLLKPIVAYLHSVGIGLVIYLDGILLLNQTAQGAERDFLTTAKILK